MPFNPAQNPFLNDFQGGQMTDLPAYPGTFDLTALVEVVSPGNAANGVNYAATFAQLIQIIGSGYNPTFVLSGSTYNSVATDTRILVNKTVGSATTVALLAATSYSQPIIIKDIKGDADVNNIMVTFAGTYDGAASPLVITVQYGWITMNPLPNGNWYAT